MSTGQSVTFIHHHMSTGQSVTFIHHTGSHNTQSRHAVAQILNCGTINALSHARHNLNCLSWDFMCSLMFAVQDAIPSPPPPPQLFTAKCTFKVRLLPWEIRYQISSFPDSFIHAGVEACSAGYTDFYAGTHF